MRMLLAVLLALQAEHPVGTWVKRTPLPDGPPVPRLGYEGDCVWIPELGKVLRYGGHNQGGGGEQGSEVWLCDPFTGRWEFRTPAISPPGVCCAQQNVYDPAARRYLRFPSFSGSHGWQWRREIELNTSAVWIYDPHGDAWRQIRNLPEPRLAPLRCASWDADHEVVLLFGGEGSREGTWIYDPRMNAWHARKPARQPDFRSGGNLAYDARRRRHLLFGSQFSDDPRVWSYDLKADAWTDLGVKATLPTKENDAVIAFDAPSGELLALVKVSGGKDEAQRHEVQTWALDLERKEWRRVNPAREPDAAGSRARVLMAAPERNLILLENCPSKPREQQIWTYRHADGPGVRPRLPLRLERTGADAVTLRWDALPEESRLLRATGSVPWDLEWTEAARIPAGPGERRVDGLEAGVHHHFVIESVSTRASTVLSAPEGLWVSAEGEGAFRIEWTPVPGAEGYLLERARVKVRSDDELPWLKRRTPPRDRVAAGAIEAIGPFEPAGPLDAGAHSWTDRPGGGAPSAWAWSRIFRKEDLDPEGRPYPTAVFAYRVRARDSRGAAGAVSETVLSIPSQVRSLRVRERGSAAELRWERSPETGIAGYLVYRMDGRFDKEPVTRLTPQPVKEAAFTDEAAGRKTRRYYVTAVDATGQEGAPSAPAWYEREWKPWYRPFEGEWHP
jgi:hypothetical protein